MKDPFFVTYNDLIESTERNLEWMRSAYPPRVKNGTMCDWTAQHFIAVEEAKVKLFKKFKKDPRIDLFTTFQNQTK